MTTLFPQQRHTLIASYLRPTRQSCIDVCHKATAPTSLIFSPEEGQRILTSDVVIKGYAVADISREIESVELSLDAGKTWQQADLSPCLQPAEWHLWRKTIHLTPGQYTVLVRATDNLQNKGPADVDLTWHQVYFEVVP